MLRKGRKTCKRELIYTRNLKLKNFSTIPLAIQRKDPLQRPERGYPKEQVLFSVNKIS